jgi:hypothetical protein
MCYVYVDVLPAVMHLSMCIQYACWLEHKYLLVCVYIYAKLVCVLYMAEYHIHG